MELGIQRSPQDRRQAGPLECAGKAQRRRRFGCAGTARRASQSGVALRLPPHSRIASATTECSPSHGPLSMAGRALCLRASVVQIKGNMNHGDTEPQRKAVVNSIRFQCSFLSCLRASAAQRRLKLKEYPPMYCLKIPTGGGETPLAMKTIDHVQNIYLHVPRCFRWNGAGPSRPRKGRSCQAAGRGS